jgi:hypothetical protein
MAYFRLLAQNVAAQLFGCFGLLDAGPYRVEGGGVTSGFVLPLGLMDGRRWKSQRVQVERVWAMNALEFWDAAATIVLRNLRLAYRERRSQAGLGQLCCWPTFGSREGLRIATQAALMTSEGC